MKISVIIPAYNAAKTIDKCINSIISQSYKNLEIIIINDGSKDNTLEICKKYESIDSRIIIIDNENNGVSYSRNCGMETSSGDYITFVDSDDYLELDCYEKIVANLGENIDFVRYNFKLDGDSGFSNNIYELSNKRIDFNCETRENLFYHFLTSNEKIPNLVMLLVIKRDIAKKLKFNCLLTMMEDVEFYLQLFLNSTTGYFLDEKLYNYYINPLSVTHNYRNNKKNILGILTTNVEIMNFGKKYFNKELIQSINANHLRIISNLLIDSYRFKFEYYKEIRDEIVNEDNYKKIINDKRYTPIKNRILLNLIQTRISFFQKMYLFILKGLYKLKK